MAKRKYYAVKNGRTVGIFTDWDTCKMSVDGFAGAEYKSFSVKKDAEAYLIDGGTSTQSYECFNEKAVIAYVDGSYDVNTERYAFGCVLLTPDHRIIEKNGAGNDAQAKTARNVAGELLATMFAVNWAAKNGYGERHMYHDYAGIAMWYEKRWKAESYCAVKYLEYMENYRKKIDIKFIKVAAHTGVEYNELADTLAKKALGIG